METTDYRRERTCTPGRSKSCRTRNRGGRRSHRTATTILRILGQEGQPKTAEIPSGHIAEIAPLGCFSMIGPLCPNCVAVRRR